MASLTDPLAKELLAARYVASLATQNREGSIHAVAVWYWFDGKAIYVATSARSRKARNLAENPNVSEQTIRALAGHVSRQMLERYSHIRSQAKQAAIQALELGAIEPDL